MQEIIWGKESSGENCRKALLKYLGNPTEDNKLQLAVAFDEVPQGYRRYVVGEMGDRDTAITVILERNHMEQARLTELRKRYFHTDQEINDLRRKLEVKKESSRRYQR